MPETTNKPIDRGLALFGIAMGIAFFLIPKTPIAIIICLVIMFALLIHPLWKFWWIERSRNRQIIACLFLVACLFLLGRAAWPPPVLPQSQIPDVKSMPPEQALSKEIQAKPRTVRPSPKTTAPETDKHVKEKVKQAAKEIGRQTEGAIEELNQREITFEQREEIVKELKTQPTEMAVYILSIGDKEAFNYAQEIAGTLFAAGWNVKIINYDILPRRYGIQCIADSNKYPGLCDTVVLAFAKAGLVVEAGGSLPGLPGHLAAILVGLKP
jgi:hypothetical protein